MGKKVIIPRTTKNHHQKTSKPLKPSNNVDRSHRQNNSSNDKDNNSLSLIKVVPPKVYIIDKSSFKSKVQQLTGYVGMAPSPAPDISFTNLYFQNHFEGTLSNSFPCSSMNDFAGYNSLSDNYSQTASPESLSFSSLDCTLSEVYNPSNELFSFEDLESWILDMVEPEPEVSIYDYELSGLIL